MSDDPECNGIPSQEGLEREISEAAHVLHDQVASVRSGMARGDWSRLVRWQRLWLWLRALCVLSLMASAYLLFWLVIAAMTGGLKPSSSGRIAWTPVIVVLATTPLVRFAMWIVAHLAQADVARLAWTGHNPQLVAEALWKEHYAHGLEQGRSEIAAEQVARARLSAEALAGPAWYRIESSGAHLIFWLSALTLVVSAATRWHTPVSVYGPALAVFIPGALSKITFWTLYGTTTTAAKVGRLHLYRWWARGWLPMTIALAPRPSPCC